MPKSKTKLMKVKTDFSQDTEGISEVFGSIIGATDGSNLHLHMAHPKFIKMKSEINRFVYLLEVMADLPFMSYQQDFVIENFQNFVVDVRTEFDELFCSDEVMMIDQFMSPMAAAAIGTKFTAYTPSQSDYANIPKSILDDFSNSYGKIKNHNIMTLVLTVYELLSNYEDFIGDKDKLDGDFLLKMSQRSFNPFSVSGIIDFRNMYVDSQCEESDKNDILVILHKLLTISRSIYELSNTSDIDITEFVEIVRNSLSTVKKQIPRCDQAFDEIMNSLHLLTSNFDGYYKDFSDTGNSTIMIEGFIGDVAKNTKNSPTLARQFKQIIGHYRKISAQMSSSNNAKASKIKGLMDMIDRRADDIEEMTSNANYDDDNGAAEEDE